jgi:GH18 family chitinase
MSIYGSKKLAIDNFSIFHGWNSFDSNPRQIADVNGDGLADIVGFGYDTVYAALGQSDGTFGSAFVAKNDGFTVTQGEWTSFDKYPRQLADVNGDGLADIVGFGYDTVYAALGQSDGTFGSAFVAKNDGFTVTQGEWTSFDKYPRQLADVNGDGRADIVGFGYDTVYVALGQNDGTFGSAFVAKNDGFTVTQGEWTSFDQYPRQLADVNGDGRADIVGFGYDTVYVALGQNDGTFGSAFVAKNDGFTVTQGEWTSFDQYPRQLADVNGDGRADIIGFADDAIHISLGQTDGTFAPTSVDKNDDFTVKGGWNSFDQYPRQLADVNGDNRADIVGFAQDATYVALANDQEFEPNPQSILAGYIGAWNIDRDTDPASIPANKLTHLFYAFVDVDPQGNVSLRNAGKDDDISFLQSLKAENPNLKILVSIGGALEDDQTEEDDFSSAAATPESRTHFAQSAIQFMKDNGFDGIDIDWEFPDPDHNDNYTQLLGELRQQLDYASTADGKNYQLTTALPASRYYLYDDDPDHHLEPILKETSEYVDFINVMTYDYHGSWSGDTTTYHQAALYSNLEKGNADWGIQQYLNAGVEAKDIVLGVPLYGRTWTGVNGGENNDGLLQSGTVDGTVEGTPLYKDLHKKVGTDGYVEYWDDSAKVPYIYSEQEGVFSTYENNQSVLEKVNYVEQYGLGGMFFWELSGDLPINNPDSLVNVAASNLM